jgi:hypothetical protein
MVSATDPHDRILGFLDRIRYYFFPNSQAKQAYVITDLITALWRFTLKMALKRSIFNRE